MLVVLVHRVRPALKVRRVQLEQLEQPVTSVLLVQLDQQVLLETRDRLVHKVPLDPLAPLEQQDSRDQLDHRVHRVQMVCRELPGHQDLLDLPVALDLQERLVCRANRVQ
jgi:hypothetical protein